MKYLSSIVYDLNEHQREVLAAAGWIIYQSGDQWIGVLLSDKPVQPGQAVWTGVGA